MLDGWGCAREEAVFSAEFKPHENINTIADMPTNLVSVLRRSMWSCLIVFSKLTSRFLDSSERSHRLGGIVRRNFRLVAVS